MSRDFRSMLLELMDMEVSVRRKAKLRLKEHKKPDPKWKLMPVFFIGIIAFFWGLKLFRAPNTVIFSVFVDIFGLLVMLLGICGALWGFAGVMAFIGLLKLKKTNAEVDKYNSDILRMRDEEYARFVALQNELIRMKNSTPGMEKAFYFFEAPFDRDKRLQDLNLPDAGSLKDGSSGVIFVDNQLKFGQRNGQLIFKGFSKAPPLKLSQLSPYLLGPDNRTLYLDADYMLAHRDDNYFVSTVWEGMMVPDYQYRTVTNYSTVNPESAMRSLERRFDEFERGLNMGFTNEEAYISGKKGYWEYAMEADMREKAGKEAEATINRYNAGASTSELNLVGMKMLLMGSGYAIISGKRLVAIVLPGKEATLLRLEYSLFKELSFDAAPPLEGLVQKLEGVPATPNHMNAITHILETYGHLLPPFNPLAARPTGVSLELWRGWMEEWYRLKK